MKSVGELKDEFNKTRSRGKKQRIKKRIAILLGDKAPAPVVQEEPKRKRELKELIKKNESRVIAKATKEQEDAAEQKAERKRKRAKEEDADELVDVEDAYRSKLLAKLQELA